jgi:hypothetical protein
MEVGRPKKTGGPGMIDLSGLGNVEISPHSSKHELQ